MPSQDDPVAGPAFGIRGERGPLIATAVHAGHVVRPEVADRLAVTSEERRYEEDPYTDRWSAAVGGLSFVVHRSRFECDLDRARGDAVYRGGEDAWGLEVWAEPLPGEVVLRSLAGYDAVYAVLENVITDTIVREGAFVLLDFHAYNRRRSEEEEPGRPGMTGPKLRIDRDTVSPRWAAIVNGLVDDLSRQRMAGRFLDVQGETAPGGGEVVRWANRRFGDRGFAVRIAIEKVTMDEHTGELFLEREMALEEAFARAGERLLKALASSRSSTR